MSGFDLVPVDGRDRVHLPPGQTVLGRGPLLDISDTRVSRHHGLLENLNGQLRLKPTHVNPCFVQSSLSDDPQPLPKGSWFRLHHGDLFSLLPGQFIYRVEAVGGEARTPRNSQNFQEEYGLSVSAEPDVGAPPDVGQEQKRMSPPSAAPIKADRHFRQNDLTRPVEDVQTTMVLSEPRRRVLPAWMITAAPTYNLKAVKRSKQPAVSSAMQATPTPTSLPEEAWLSEEEERRPRKKSRKMNNKEEKQETETDDPLAGGSKVSRKGNTSSQTSNGGKVEDRKSSDGGEVEDRKSSDGGEVEGRKSSDGGEVEGRKSSDGSEVDDRNSSDGGKAKDRKLSEWHARTPCPYGTDCYRKNPLHFQEFCHPGDTDHQEEQDRPECPYGTNCYRKNPLHRKQFRHTQEAARSTRAKRIPDQDEDEDSGDEDSEDIGEDSDYVPLNSEDSEQEVFLKKRK